MDIKDTHSIEEIFRDWKFALHKASPNLLSNGKISIDLGQKYPAKVPGTLHTDLMNNDLIPDPFYSDNELSLTGIDESDWIYTNQFEFHPDSKKNYRLVFDGIDTISEIYLNDYLVGSTNNMFCKYNIKISSCVFKR